MLATRTSSGDWPQPPTAASRPVRERLILILALLGFAAIGSLLVAGCGGGEGGGFGGPSAFTPASRVEDNLTSLDSTLDDGSYFKAYQVTAFSSGTAYVEMDSGDFDAYLIVYELNSDGSLGNKVAEDDDSAGNRNALASFTAFPGQDYLVIATTSAPGELGSYTLYLSDALGNATAVDFSGNNTRASRIRPYLHASKLPKQENSRPSQKP